MCELQPPLSATEVLAIDQTFASPLSTTELLAMAVAAFLQLWWLRSLKHLERLMSSILL